MSLLSRAGTDCLSKLEAAAKQRYDEARQFQTARPLLALYLFGYSIEMRLKIAYFRLIGHTPNSPLGKSRQDAENKIKQMIKSGSIISTTNIPAGHNIMGWAHLLEETRVTSGRTSPTGFYQQMHQHAEIVAENWSIVLRYRVNKPTIREIAVVSDAATWFKRNARKLWR